MSECGARAILIITRDVEGTATHVARRRVELCCRLAPGHAGAHRDLEHEEEWNAPSGQMTTLLRHQPGD